MADEYHDDDYDEEPLEDLENLQEGEEEIGEEKESKITKFLKTHHPECRIMYMEEVAKSLPMESYPPKLGTTTSKHRTVPYLTLFEKTKVIGFRANQLSQGAVPLVKVPEHITDVLDIARLELDERRLPFILARPMPDGTYEYWRLSDLLII